MYSLKSPSVEANLEKGVHNVNTEKSISDGENTDNADIESIRTVPRSASIPRCRTHQENANTKISNRIIRSITTRSNADIVDPGPPPDGGLIAWTQACMAHLVVFNTWGMVATFGVFQTYYTSELGLEPSAVSWIGSTQMLGHFSLGMFSGRALDGGLFYWVLIPGMVLGCLSMFLTSLCTQYYQLFLAQGIMFGIACGLQFTPATSLVYTYFSSNKVVAIAVVASGSATGGLVYPTIARQLIPRIGFPWTVRISASIMLAVGCCYASLLKPRLPPRKSGPLLELSAFKEPPYTLYVIGVFLTLLGQYFGFYYIGSYALDVVGVSYDTSVNLLMIMNGIGLVGRIIPGYLADLKFGGYNTMIPFVFSSAIIIYCWATVKTTVGLYIFVAFYGFASAGFQGLFPSTLSSLTKDWSKMGVRNGQGFSIVGVAAFVGPPIAGAIVQQGGYFRAQMWAASVMFVGGVVLVLGRLAKTGAVLRTRI